MNTDANELLEESIKASNRTTHAVKVLAKFLLIQLAATTAALVLYFLAIISSDATELPIIIAVTVLFAGTVWAIYVGWTELGLSADPLLLNPEGPAEKSTTDTHANYPEDGPKIYKLTVAEHKLWLEAGLPRLLDWDGQSDFVDWLEQQK